MFGTEAEKPTLKLKMDKLQRQLNSIKGNQCEVVYSINDTESIEEKKEFLLCQTLSRHYVWCDVTTEVDNYFLLKRLNMIKQGKGQSQLLQLGVFQKPVHPILN